MTACRSLGQPSAATATDGAGFGAFAVPAHMYRNDAERGNNVFSHFVHKLSLQFLSAILT